MKHRETSMRKSTTRLVVGGVAALAALGFAGGVALATGNPGNTPLNLRATDASRVAMATQNATQSRMQHGAQPGPSGYMTSVHLQAMPVGTVSFQTSGTTLEATLSATGLTPGSTHAAEITFSGGKAPIVFSPFTASSTGQVDTTISSVGQTDGLPETGTFQIELSTSPDQPIALAPVAGASMNQTVRLQAFNPTGVGHLGGQAKLEYNSQAKTLTVTVDASGFEAHSVHAAHIHAGSCASQGAVLYMLHDLHADAQGRIHQTDVLQNVTNFQTPAGGWYLNIHRGDSADILNAQGQPTANFRPLLCSDLPATSPGMSSQPYTFQTLNNPADPTFNQLLGINDHGTIAGYFGSGQPGHPNKGYLLARPYSSYLNENFPGSVQTQVTGLNNRGYTVGFWADANNDNFGFAEHNGLFTVYQDPATGTGTVNQLLGVNDSGTAVGFYTDGSGASHGYEVDLATGRYTPIQVPGATTTVASGINEEGDVTGFSTNAHKVTFGWVLHDGRISTFGFPGSTNTTPLGINAEGEIVGAYVDGGGNTHGFTLSDRSGHEMWATVNDPNGTNSTTVNGVNDRGQLVGFYTDAAGNTDGFVASK